MTVCGKCVGGVCACVGIQVMCMEEIKSCSKENCPM